MAATRAPTSYFSNSDLASSGIPQGDELKLLEPYRAGTAARAVHRAVHAAGHRRLRQQPRRIAQGARPAGAGRLEGEGPQAGRCERPADDLHHPAGRPVAASAWRCRMCRSLQKIGIDVRRAHGRSGPVPAPDRRLRLRYDDDGLSGKRHPGQRTARTTSPAPAAKAQGSDNMPGVCDPAVDALVEKVITAQDRTR